MEYGSRLRFALITIAGIILLVLSIWGVTSIAKNILSPSKSTTSTSKQVALDDYATGDSKLVLTTEGPIVADEKFQSYEITVTQNYKEFKLYKGYNKVLVSSKHYDNNPEAYINFIKALQHNNFTSKNKTVSDDERGNCASGSRYVYQLTNDNQDVVRSWGSSCGGGNFTGTGANARSLFKAQIPDFNDLSSSINF